jgi:hypothetical protein
MKRQSKKNNIVRCPKCGRMGQKRGRWKMKDGSFNRRYVHSGIYEFAMITVTDSCIVREDGQQ